MRSQIFNDSDFMEDEIVEITKDEMQRYEGVRQSGVTNMFLINNVCEIANLSREKVVFIMKHYHGLMQKYGLNKVNIGG